MREEGIGIFYGGLDILEAWTETEAMTVIWIIYVIKKLNIFHDS